MRPPHVGSVSMFEALTHSKCDQPFQARNPQIQQPGLLEAKHEQELCELRSLQQSAITEAMAVTKKMF